MRSHFAIVTTDADQPHLVRIHADNGAQIYRSSENYADVRDAERAVCVTAEMFYLGTATLVDVPELELAGQKRISIMLASTPHAQGKALFTPSVLSVPVIYLDERRKCRVCGCSEYSPCSPPCHWVADDLCSNPTCVESVAWIDEHTVPGGGDRG